MRSNRKFIVVSAGMLVLFGVLSAVWSNLARPYLLKRHVKEGLVRQGMELDRNAARRQSPLRSSHPTETRLADSDGPQPLTYQQTEYERARAKDPQLIDHEELTDSLTRAADLSSEESARVKRVLLAVRDAETTVEATRVASLRDQLRRRLAREVQRQLSTAVASEHEQAVREYFERRHARDHSLFAALSE